MRDASLGPGQSRSLYCTNRREGFQRLPIFISKNSTAVHKASAVLEQEPDPKPTMGDELDLFSSGGGELFLF